MADINRALRTQGRSKRHHKTMPVVCVDDGKTTYPFEVSTESGAFSALSKLVSEHFGLGAEDKLKFKNGELTVSSDHTLNAALKYLESERAKLRLTLAVTNTAAYFAPAPPTQSNPLATGSSPSANSSPDSNASGPFLLLMDKSTPAQNATATPGGEEGEVPDSNASGLGGAAKAAGKRKASNSSAKKRGREMTPEEEEQMKAKLKEAHESEWGKLDAGKHASLGFLKYLLIVLHYQANGKPIKTSADGIYAEYPRSIGAMFDGGCFVKMGDVLSQDALVKFDAWADEKNLKRENRKDHKCALNKFISLLSQAKEQGLLY